MVECIWDEAHRFNQSTNRSNRPNPLITNPHHTIITHQILSAIHRALGGRHAVLRLDNFRFKASARLGHDIEVEVTPKAPPADYLGEGCVLVYGMCGLGMGYNDYDSHIGHRFIHRL